jgi:solute carrier family 25 thiamine pyrophosphate transporter 19
MQPTQVYRGMLDAARGVVSKHGVLGLYSGLSVTLLEIVPYAALQFGLYDLFTSAAASARTKVRHVRKSSTQHTECASGLLPRISAA